MSMFKRSTTSAKGFDWAGLGWMFLFFWYFSGITQLLIQLTGTSGFSGFRQAFFMSALWLAPMLLFPRRARLLAGLIGVVLWACSMASLGYFFIYQQEFSQSVIFIMFESNISEAGDQMQVVVGIHPQRKHPEQRQGDTRHGYRHQRQAQVPATDD